MPLEASGWAEFRSLFRIKISLLGFEISSKMCEPKDKFNMPSRPQLWRHYCNYDVLHFFESLTSKTSGTERDTDIIHSLLQSTRQRLLSRVLFQYCKRKKNHFGIYQEKASIMAPWWQFRRNTFFRIFDIEHLRNGKRYRHNSITVAIYSTKAIIWRLISVN